MKTKLTQMLNDSKYSVSFSWWDEGELLEKTGMPIREIEDAAITQGVVPARYQRNLGAISLDEQRNLLHKRVTVVGCGCLGECVIEELARIGVGTISAWDYDYFKEHNLNRHIMAESRLIGHSKIKSAGQRVRRINPGVVFHGICEEFNLKVGEDVLKEQDAVVDTLDNARARLELSEACRKNGIPLVHGSVCGWSGQVCTQFPRQNIIEQIYKNKESFGVDENKRSVLAFVPAIVASLQAAEVLKILLNRGTLLRNQIMMVDMLEMDIKIINIEPEADNEN